MNRPESQTSGVVKLQKVNKSKVRRSRELRQNMTEAEKVLWKHLRNRNLCGLKFRRQQIIDGFIADFFCEKLKLCVEIDGPVHDESAQKETDMHRTSVFKDRGIQVLRLKNEQVLNDMQYALHKIITFKIQHPSPAGEGPA